MRAVTQTDLGAAARVLLALPEPARRAEARALLIRAQAANCYRRKTGRQHPFWGNGSLASVALLRARADPATPGDPDYLACMALMIEVILEGLTRVPA